MCTIGEFLEENVMNETEKATVDYPDSTFMVVSKVAYLIGVPKRITYDIKNLSTIEL